jgi:hypothetical protein
MNFTSPFAAKVSRLCGPARYITMRLYLVLSSLLALTISFVSGTALTYKLNGNEKSCFYTNVERENAKVAFYFAVCITPPVSPIAC